MGGRAGKASKMVVHLGWGEQDAAWVAIGIARAALIVYKFLADRPPARSSQAARVEKLQQLAVRRTKFM